MIPALIIFFVMYILMLAFQGWRPWIALSAAGLLTALGYAGLYGMAAGDFFNLNHSRSIYSGQNGTATLAPLVVLFVLEPTLHTNNQENPPKWKPYGPTLSSMRTATMYCFRSYLTI